MDTQIPESERKQLELICQKNAELCDAIESLPASEWATALIVAQSNARINYTVQKRLYPELYK